MCVYERETEIYYKVLNLAPMITMAEEIKICSWLVTWEVDGVASFLRLFLGSQEEPMFSLDCGGRSSKS